MSIKNPRYSHNILEGEITYLLPQKGKSYPIVINGLTLTHARKRVWLNDVL
jgi:hypothetical protein